MYEEGESLLMCNEAVGEGGFVDVEREEERRVRLADWTAACSSEPLTERSFA